MQIRQGDPKLHVPDKQTEGTHNPLTQLRSLLLGYLDIGDARNW